MLTLLGSGARQSSTQLHHCVRLLRLNRPVPPLPLLMARRCILSAAFACDDAWRARLSAPEFNAALSGLDLGNGLLRALDRSELVAAVDVDIYANKLDGFELAYLPFFASVLAKFRCTQEALDKLESTDHALVRCMLALGQAELLVDWLRDKFTYGIFLDQYSASLLIDHLLKAGNARLATLVSFDHALQDSPSDGWLCSGLMLLACSARAAEQMPAWCEAAAIGGGGADDEAAAKGANDEGDDEEDDPDMQHVIVDYIRLPNYDGHFDLDDEKLQLGHTLACLSRRLLAWQPRHPVGVACALVGLAACEKPGQIVAMLAPGQQQQQQQLPTVSRSVVEAADALLSAVRTLPDGATDERPGRRHRCAASEVEAARAALRHLTVSPDSQTPWHDEAALFAKQLISDNEPAEAQNLAKLYAEFDSSRLAELRRHSDWLRRRQLFQGVKSQLDGLAEEQEALTAFDNSAEIQYAAWLAPRTRAERSVTSKQVWGRDIANANRLLDEASEAARSGGSGSSGGGLVLPRRSSSRKEKFRPLKE